MISISLLMAFFYLIGVNKIIEEISHASIPLFLTALLIENAGVFVSAKRWQILLKEKKINLAYMEALSFYYMGSFFNTMMPTSFGGDVIKAYKLGRLTNTAHSFSSVIMDRIAGLIAVAIIATTSIVLFHSFLTASVILITLLIILSFTLLLLLSIKTEILERIISLIFSRWVKLERFLEEVMRAFKDYKGKRIWGYVISISLLYHMMLIINNYILALSLNLNIKFFYFLIFIPVSQILVALPISIQGFGVREGSYAMLFPAAGVAAAAAFSLGFLNQIIKVLTSMIGGVIYVIKK